MSDAKPYHYMLFSGVLELALHSRIKLESNIEMNNCIKLLVKSKKHWFFAK
jgi:hypothetical protein